MAEIDPGCDKECKVWAHKRMIEIVESFRGLYPLAPRTKKNMKQSYSKEEITNVMRNKDRNTHVREVESITQEDEGQRYDVMANEFLEVLSRLLHPQKQNDSLLSPKGCLEEVVELEISRMCLVRKVFVHPNGIEIPYGCPAHDIHACRTQKAKIYGRIHLFHESRLLGSTLESAPACKWPEDFLHDELASKGEHNNVEEDKSYIPGTLAILHRRVRLSP